jgi:hypothetical protein
MDNVKPGVSFDAKQASDCCIRLGSVYLKQHLVWRWPNPVLITWFASGKCCVVIGQLMNNWITFNVLYA